MNFSLKILFFFILFSFVTLKAQEKNFEILKRQGIIHMANSKYGEAIDLFNKYITANPQDAEGYNLRGLSYEKRQVYEYAVLDLRRAINLTPNNSVYKANLSRVISIWYPILYKKIEGHKREIAINPKSAFDHLEIGKSYRWLEEWKLAELWYDKYLVLDDNASPDEIIRYSIILAKTGSIKKGERVLKKWVDRYPEDWRLWSRYGYFTLWLGNRDNAANAFRSSLSFKPFFKEAQDGLDIATEKGYMVKNEPRAYERGYPIDVNYAKLKKNPANSETRFELIGLLIDADRIEEAREQLNILKTDYENSDEYKELDARLTPLMITKYSSLLEENLAKLKQFPNDKTIVKNVADYYVRLKQYDEANEIMKEYLDLEPDDYEMKEYYADILAYSGNYTDAANILSELIENGHSSNLIVQKAANYFGNDFDYFSSIDLLSNYIGDKPIEDVKELKFQLAQYYAWNYQWDDALNSTEELLEAYPNNNKYKLFRSQLIVWTVDDTEFESAQVSFNEILKEDPNNLESLLGLATIYSWKRDYPEAKKYIDKLKQLYPDNSEISSVENFYNAQISLEPDRKRLEKRAEIGELVEKEDYNSALDLFSEYFEMDPQPSRQVYKEYAQINLAVENYDEAIKIYENLLAEEYEENIAYDRASAYLWKGDSLNALNQFLELSKQNPENYDYKMGLAESYLINKEYGNADDIYDEILDVTKDTAKENYIKRRKDMMPLYGLSANLNSAFKFMIPQNISFIPSSTLYDDNQMLTYYQYGLRAEIGLFRYFTIGGTWMRTDIFSLSTSQTLTELSGQLYFHPFPKFSIGGSLGKLDIQRELKKNIGTIEARWYSDDLIVNIGYKDTDSRLVLFSPFLIDVNLTAFVYYFAGNYRYKNKYKLLLFYQYFNISDGNLANDFRFRLGKAFQENIFWGYEYFFSDFGFSSATYYSPQEYSTHSIWIDYEYKKVKKLDLIFGGEIGYAPSVDFIVGNIYADASYKVLENLLINGRATYGNSYRFDSSYQFISIFLSAYWSIW